MAHRRHEASRFLIHILLRNAPTRRHTRSALSLLTLLCQSQYGRTATVLQHVTLIPTINGSISPGALLSAGYCFFCLTYSVYSAAYPSLPPICETPFGDSVLPRQWNSFSSFYCVHSFLCGCTSYPVHFQRVRGERKLRYTTAKKCGQISALKKIWANRETARKNFST